MLAEGKVQRSVQVGEEDKYYMYYALKGNTFEEMQGLGNGNIGSLRDVFLIDDSLNLKYISNNGKEYGDNISNKILEDETEIRFSNKAFSEYISKMSGIAEEEMSFKWTKNLKALELIGHQITSLEDLVFFPNLTVLTLNSVKLNNLKGIENCKKLNQLSAYTTDIKDFSSISSLSEITNIAIFFGNNNVKNLISSIKNYKNLNTFTMNSVKGDYDYNIIKDLPVSLKRLEIQNSGELIKNIDGIQKLINLTYLNLNDNKITSIDKLKYLTNLKELYLKNNKIVDITPLSENIYLIKLDLKGNLEIDGNRNNYSVEQIKALDKISEILDREGVIYLDSDKLGLFTNYKSLDLSNQNLATLDVLKGMTELTSLNISNNQLTLEDETSKNVLKEMKKLEYLNLNNNNITNITEIRDMSNLKELYLNANKITDISVINNLKNLKRLFLMENSVNLVQIEDIISNLTDFKISTESLKTIVNCDVNKITKLNIPYSAITMLPDLSKLSQLTQLDISNNPSISNIEEVSKISSLQILSLKNNNLHKKMINFSRLTNLTSLDLSNNSLWSEDLENLKDLKTIQNLTINLNNNVITDATTLLELNENTNIHLSNNVNLSQDSKNKLKARFGNKVNF